MPTWTRTGLRIASGAGTVVLVCGAVLPAWAQPSSGVEQSLIKQSSVVAKSLPPGPAAVQRASPGTLGSAEPAYKELPDSPSVTLAKLQQADPVKNSSAPSPAGPSPDAQSSNPPVSAPAQPTQDQPGVVQSAPVQPGPVQAAPVQAAPVQPVQAAPQPSTPKPEGTAAAGANPATGVAASQPAGMAIAPAKQHRTRTLVLRTGAILGAGVALGTVFALTEGTSSKPPGAR
jgi:hypothetical protein